MESKLINIVDTLAPIEFTSNRKQTHMSNEKITRLINKKRKHMKNWKPHNRVADRISANKLNNIHQSYLTRFLMQGDQFELFNYLNIA